MQNYLDLTGKVALVTGASSGIGAATALCLAEQGAAVAINYNRNEAGAKQVQEQITAAGGRAIVIQADVTKPADIRAMVERTTNELGAIDILINNAGSLVERMKLLELTEERWDDVMNLNLKSVVQCMQAVAPAMIMRGGNVFVTTLPAPMTVPPLTSAMITACAPIQTSEPTASRCFSPCCRRMGRSASSNRP